MFDEIKLIFLVLGNILKWLYYAGKKPMEEVAKEDNALLGFIAAIFIFFFLYSFK